MSGPVGLHKSPDGVDVGQVQLQRPLERTPAQPKAQAERVDAMVGEARRNLGPLGRVVFREYALHGRFRRPWAASVRVTDGTGCGLATRSRRHRGTETNPFDKE